MTPQIQSGDGGGVLAADYQHISVVVRVGVAVVVRDLGQIFAGNAELVKEIVIASGDDYFASFCSREDDPLGRWP